MKLKLTCRVYVERKQIYEIEKQVVGARRPLAIVAQPIREMSSRTSLRCYPLSKIDNGLIIFILYFHSQMVIGELV